MVRNSTLVLVALTLFAQSAALAANVSLTGTLLTDDATQLFHFTISTTRTVTFQSYGFGGGTSAVGAAIPAGGFDSYFTWYLSNGTQIGTNDDGCGLANTTVNGCADAYFSGSLDAGSYILALTVSGNSPQGDLSAGFSQTGNPGWSACAAGDFCDAFQNAHTGAWAVDLLNVDVMTPEPATLMLLPTGLALAAILRRKSSRCLGK